MKKKYEAVSMTSTGKQVVICDTMATSIEEARRVMANFLWMSNCMDAKIREAAAEVTH